MTEIGKFKIEGKEVILEAGKKTVKKEELKKDRSLESIFNKLNKADKNGAVDDILDENEIKDFTQKLVDAAGEDGDLSEEEAQEFLKKQGLENVGTNKLMEFINRLTGREDSVQQPPVNSEHGAIDNTPDNPPVVSEPQSQTEDDKTKILVTYPKNGETFEQTAARLGFQKGTPEYEEFMGANTEAGKRKWFKVGEQVKIPKSIQDKVNQEELLDETESEAEVQKYTADYNAKQEQIAAQKEQQRALAAAKKQAEIKSLGVINRKGAGEKRVGYTGQANKGTRKQSKLTYTVVGQTGVRGREIVKGSDGKYYTMAADGSILKEEYAQATTLFDKGKKIKGTIKVKQKDGSLKAVSRDFVEVGNLEKGRKSVVDSKGRVYVMSHDGKILDNTYLQRDAKADVISKDSKAAQNETVSLMSSQLDNAQAAFDNQMAEDGWAGDVADGISILWGSKNRASVVRKELAQYKSDLAELQKYSKAGDNSKFNAKFIEMYGIAYNQKAVANYTRFPTAANYKKAFGTKNDIGLRVAKYNESQQTGAAVVKGAATVAAGIAVGVATGGVGLAAMGVAAAGTAAASFAINASDRVSSDVGLKDGELGQIAENALWDGGSVLAGGVIGKVAGTAIRGTTKAAGIARAATSAVGDVGVGAAQEYAQTGEVTLEGTAINAAMGAVGMAAETGALKTAGQKIKNAFHHGGKETPTANVNVKANINEAQTPEVNPLQPHDAVADGETVRNIDQSHVSAKERQMIDEGLEDVPTPEEMAAYQKENGYQALTAEERGAIERNNAEAAKANAEAHEIGNNISSEQAESLNNLKNSFGEETHGTGYFQDATGNKFTLEDGKITKIETTDGRVLTDELKIAKYENKYNVNKEELSPVGEQGSAAKAESRADSGSRRSEQSEEPLQNSAPIEGEPKSVISKGGNDSAQQAEKPPLAGEDKGEGLKLQPEKKSSPAAQNNDMRSRNEVRDDMDVQNGAARAAQEVDTPEVKAKDSVEKPELVKPEQEVNAAVQSVKDSDIPKAQKQVWNDCKAKIDEIAADLKGLTPNFSTISAKIEILFNNIETLAKNVSVEVRVKLTQLKQKVTAMYNAAKSTINSGIENLKDGIAQAMPEKPTQSVSPARIKYSSAIEQSKNFNSTHKVAADELVMDGYKDGGRGLKFDENGNPLNTPYREIILVNRNQDKKLQSIISDVKKKTEGMTAKKKAAFLQKYIYKISGEKNISNANMKSWDRANTGKEILLGDIITAKPAVAVCRHRSLLFKILGDEVGLNIELQRGDFLAGGHAWNTVAFDDGTCAIYDAMHNKTSSLTPGHVDNYAQYYKNVNGEPLYPNGLVRGKFKPTPAEAPKRPNINDVEVIDIEPPQQPNVKAASDIEVYADYSSEPVGTALPKGQGVALTGNETLQLADYEFDMSAPYVQAKLSKMQDGDVITVGRGANGPNDINIDGGWGSVSRKHLTIEKFGDNYIVTDLSSNGTKIGGSQKANDGIYDVVTEEYKLSSQQVNNFGKNSDIHCEPNQPVEVDLNTHIRLGEKVDIDLNDLSGKFSQMRDGDTFIIGRNVSGANDIKINNEYVSGEHLSFEKQNGKIYVTDLSSTNGTILNTTKPDYAAQWKPNIQGKYNNADATYFRGQCDKYYSELRNANYTYNESVNPNISDADIEYGVNNGLTTTQLRSDLYWIWRTPNSSKGFTDAVDRISLNVKADKNMLRELDTLIEKGEYINSQGKRIKVKVPDCEYKTPPYLEEWGTRHDPITMYFSKKISKDLESAIAEITEKYARQPSNGKALMNAVDGKPWIAHEAYTSVDEAKALYNEARRLNPELAEGISKAVAKDDGWNCSTGMFASARRVVDEYKLSLVKTSGRSSAPVKPQRAAANDDVEIVGYDKQEVINDIDIYNANNILLNEELMSLDNLDNLDNPDFF